MTPQIALNARRLPGRVDSSIAAELLGFCEHDIRFLVRGKMLKPLGNPAPYCVKYFSTHVIEALARDEAWLARATKIVNEHWHNANQRKRARPATLLSA